MKANLWAFTLISLANASGVIPRDSAPDYNPGPSKDYHPKDYYQKDPPKDYYEKDPPKHYYEKDPPKDYYHKDPPKDYYQKDSHDYHYKDPSHNGGYSKDYKPNHGKPSHSYPPKSGSKPYPANSYSDKNYDNYGPYDYKGNPGSYPDKSDYYPDKYPKHGGYHYKGKGGQQYTWKPKSSDPQFFNLRVDDECGINPVTLLPETAAECPFNGYAIRLDGGNFIATPYDKFYDPKLATFFVDDDTKLYTVSKTPLQVYIDGVSGALKYTKIGYLPPGAISTNFFHTGNNPLGLLDPSSSYLSWPSTIGATFLGYPFSLCPIGGTLQYQVFINAANFGVGGPAGVLKDGCVSEELAAVNANPWA